MNNTPLTDAAMANFSVPGVDIVGDRYAGVNATIPPSVSVAGAVLAIVIIAAGTFGKMCKVCLCV